GAREAIDEGAVCEAELALVSGMDELSEDKYTEATLLLAESLQDQSRWSESVEALVKIGDPIEHDLVQVAEMLRSTADWKLRRMGQQEAVERINKSLRAASETLSRRVRVTALASSMILLSDTHDRQSSIEALRYVKQIVFDLESPKERALRAQALAMVSNFAESKVDFDAAEDAIEAAIRSYPVQSHGQAVHSLLMAQGSFKVSKGRYEEAIPVYKRALRVAEMRGSPSSVARAIANLMMSYSRVGEFGKAIELTLEGRRVATLSNDPVMFRILFYAAWSHAMVGDTDEALKLVPTWIEGAHDAPAGWMRQACDLLASDVYYLLKRGRDGLRHARLATTGGCTLPLSRAYVGPFARAVANVATSDHLEAGGIDRIVQVAKEFDHDLMDRAEISCAKLLLIANLGGDPSLEANSLRTVLLHLPSATVAGFRGLGFERALIYAAAIH
ncbi:MAG: tetratricopeptide repeat protein, partial [Gemmatimonadota bacterium]